MHIKQITISNFRSFRQQPEIQPFSAGTNAVVGRNGSGKSNLFDAVQFALLAPRFVNLRPEERQALLHEGSGSAAVNAFVEIVFDNADHRLSLDNSDEVVLRRTIGLKKDEFFLQRKRVTNKSDITSLLESAGFSKSNPYYIVQQGKVQGLCTMSDAERLHLLKEVAGTTVYDEKKSESLAKMEENATSIEKIQSILSDIEERLQELESEKEELSQYQSLDRQRRALEYSLYDKELAKARSLLESLEEERAEHVQQVSVLHEAAKETHDAIRRVEGLLQSHTSRLRRNRRNVEGLQESQIKAVTQATQLELQCRELKEAIQSGNVELKANQQELQGLDEQIAQVKGKLQQQLQPQYQEANEKLQLLMDQRQQTVRQMEGLFEKQGRARQYATVEERDAAVRGNIAELESAKAEKESELTAQRDTLANVRRTVDKETRDVERLTNEIADKSSALQSLSKSVDEKKRERLELYDSRKEHWRKVEELQEQVREARESMSRAVSDTRKAMPRATAFGLDALRSIVEQEGLVIGEHYFGMVMDNFTIKNEKFQTAVEVAAQNALFHVIVDTDYSAAKLMKRLEEGKLGRVTFLPLSQLRVENVRYPESNDVRPLLDICIDYDPKVDRAMRHVFGKKLIARSSEVASEWSTKVSMDAITLDGDLCSRRGALTGGFVDVNKSRLRAHTRQKEAEQVLQKIEGQYQEMNRSAQQSDQSITLLMQELQHLTTKQGELNHLTTEKEKELERMKTRLASNMKKSEKMELISIPLLERGLVAMENEIKRLQDELGTELEQDLSNSDRVRLAELKDLKSKLDGEIDETSDKVEQTGLERQKLQSLLEDNLLKRRRELTEGEDEGRGRSISSIALQSQRENDLEDRQRELENALRLKDDLEKRLDGGRQIEEELRGEVISAKNELEQLKSQDQKNMKSLEEAQDKSERLMNKRSITISRRETYSRKIQELGSLPPPSELDKYSGKGISDLMKSLESVNKMLKKYSHVNKKAYDQYVNFSDQRDSLLRRKSELDQEALKVKELVENLDRQKDEAINRTFRGVSSHFKDVFRELVPSGAGELIMRTALDDSEAETDSEGSSESSRSRRKSVLDPSNPNVSLYRGVGIKVRFSEIGENYLMSQLSGGQKALVALALIFSIQRCDPAPFYLFDELDQALDATYRAAVANLIQRQAQSSDNPTQFIVSTFRPELVAVANRCYGISHQNKVSSFHPLSKKDALHFIANLMNEEEALGEVTTLSTSRVSRLALESSRKRRNSASDEVENDDGDDDDDDIEQEAKKGSRKRKVSGSDEVENDHEDDNEEAADPSEDENDN